MPACLTTVRTVQILFHGSVTVASNVRVERRAAVWRVRSQTR
jgi:hypothetical protein